MLFQQQNKYEKCQILEHQLHTKHLQNTQRMLQKKIPIKHGIITHKWRGKLTLHAKAINITKN